MLWLVNAGIEQKSPEGQSEASALTKSEKCMSTLPQSHAILETVSSIYSFGTETRSSEDNNPSISAVTSDALTETCDAANSSLSITSNEIKDSTMELRKINANDSELNGTNESELKEKTAFLEEETSTAVTAEVIYFLKIFATNNTLYYAGRKPKATKYQQRIFRWYFSKRVFERRISKSHQRVATT